MITLAEIIVNIIVLLIGALILRWIAGAIVSNAKSRSYGRALAIMILWVIIDFVMVYFGVVALLGFWVIFVYWIIFALLCVLVYDAGFGQGLLVALLMAIIVFVLVIIFGTIVGAILVALNI